MPAEESTTSSESVIISDKCLKCGTIKASGKLSCCARGGAWFKKCGDSANEKVDHTWAEGIRACESKFPKVCVVIGILYGVFRVIEVILFSMCPTFCMGFCACTAMDEVASTVDSVSRAASSTKPTATVPSTATTPITTAGML